MGSREGIRSAAPARGARFALRAVLLLLVPFLFSACVSITWSIRQPAELPQDLDSYLASREAAVPGLIPGNEKHIAWAGAHGVKTPFSVVYIHGLQGSPVEYAAVIQRAAAEIGANVFFTRLKGHGVTTEEIAGATVDDWVNDAWEALQVGSRIGDRVILVGSSLGGDLSLWLASRQQPQVAALVLFSCAVQPKDSRSGIMLWPWPIPQIMLAAVMGRYTINSIDKTVYPGANLELYGRLYPTRYRSDSYLTFMGVVRLVRTLRLEDIRVPSLWLYSEKDDAVDIPSLEKAYTRMGGTPKSLVEVKGAHAHMLAGDVFSPETNDEVTGDVVSFLRALP